MEAERRHTHSVTLPGEQLVPAYTPQESAYLESNIGVSSQHLNNNNNNNHMKPHPPTSPGSRWATSSRSTSSPCRGATPPPARVCPST